MEGFPFDKLVGLIVFVIIVVSQAWTAYREQRKQQEAAARASAERDMKRRQNDRSARAPTPATPPRQEEVPDEAEKALRDMLEALGLPPPEMPAPSQPAPPAPPPVVVAKPMPTPKPYRKPLPAPDPIPHVEEEGPAGYATARVLPKMPLPAPTRQPKHIRELREILMNRHTVQRAVMLNEILGTPKGLGKL